MNHTPNYNLSQWEAEDKVLRTDFNADNAKIDAALMAAADGRAALERTVSSNKRELTNALNIRLRCVTGTYTGDGKNSRTIGVSLRPKVMFIRSLGTDGQTIDIFENTAIHSGKTRYQSTAGSAGHFSVSIDSGSVTLRCTYSWSDLEQAELICNTKGTQYLYTILG